MPCFCKDTTLTAAPSARLSVTAVPPQMKALLGLLDLEAIDGPRMDEKLGQALPPGGAGWLRATISAQAPGVALPSPLPPGGGAVMTAMMRMSAAAKLFPLADPRRLMAELKQAVLSVSAHMTPQLQALAASSSPGLQKMALAARLTLKLRAKGVCPTTLAKVDVRAEFAGSIAKAQAAVGYAATMAKIRVPPYALTAPQLALSQSLAGMASLGDAAQASGLPPITDPKLMAALKAQIKMLAAMPMPRMSIPPEALSVLADLEAIAEAFGPDATTPAGVARVNAMLKYMASLRLPQPQLAASLKAQLDATPDLSDVMKGMETARGSGAALAASMTTSVKLPPVIGLMESLSTVSAVLTKSAGTPPLGPCGACAFPIETIAASVADMALPDAPAGIGG